MEDKNVEVIYVCPVNLGEDSIHYYTHLLGLNGPVETGKPTPSSCARSFTILTPEAHQHFAVRFTAHTYAHSTIPCANHTLRPLVRNVKCFTELELCLAILFLTCRGWQ